MVSYVSKDLFLDVHSIVSSWRVVVLDWIRQFLRDYAPFDLARRLHYEMVVSLVGVVRRYQWTETLLGTAWNGWKQIAISFPRLPIVPESMSHD